MGREEYILEMKNISKSFPGVKALDDVSLAVERGSVHSLMGENGAGKSTLMKCLFGIYTMDQGEIILNGQSVKFKNPAEALSKQVSMVHQELNQALNQTVMENMWLGRYPMKCGLVDDKEMYKETLRVLSTLGIDINPREKVGNLRVSQKQMVEIAKAVSYDSKVIVMDEPTSSLTEKESEHLFEIIKKLTDTGAGVIYISHKMEEILRISDSVTVMRDGKLIDTQKASDLTIDQIIEKMVGRELTERYPARKSEVGEVLFEVQKLAALTGDFDDVNFTVRKGEILGIAGLVGAKRTEILETLFGMRAKGSGKLVKNGEQIKNKNPREAMKNGFALLTEERRSDGVFANLSVDFNMLIANIDAYTRLGLLKEKAVQEDSERMIQSMRIKTPTVKERIGNLSGGNQQKVIFGRWLLTNPDVLLLDEPTRGIDVGAKYEIYQLMNELAEQGKGIIVVSSEMPELFGICDRILVMSNGRQAGIFQKDETTQTQIMEASAKYI